MNKLRINYFRLTDCRLTFITSISPTASIFLIASSNRSIWPSESSNVKSATMEKSPNAIGSFVWANSLNPSGSVCFKTLGIESISDSDSEGRIFILATSLDISMVLQIRIQYIYMIWQIVYSFGISKSKHNRN
jgi:hypothetical protein